MSRRDDKLSQCEGKARLTRRHADAIVKRMGKRGRRVHTYKCAHCKTWHVGTNAVK